MSRGVSESSDLDRLGGEASRYGPKIVTTLNISKVPIEIGYWYLHTILPTETSQHVWDRFFQLVSSFYKCFRSVAQQYLCNTSVTPGKL